MQEDHELETKRRTVELERATSELRRCQREAADVLAEAEAARKILQRLKVCLILVRVVFTTSQALKQFFSGHCTGVQVFR